MTKAKRAVQITQQHLRRVLDGRVVKTEEGACISEVVAHLTCVGANKGATYKCAPTLRLLELCTLKMSLNPSNANEEARRAILKEFIKATRGLKIS